MMSVGCLYDVCMMSADFCVMHQVCGALGDNLLVYLGSDQPLDHLQAQRDNFGVFGLTALH